MTGLPTKLASRPPQTTDAACPFFGVCGGCDFQDSTYPDQLIWKQAHLEETLRPLRLAPEVWQPMVHSDQAYPTFFRNKIRYGMVVREDGGYSMARHAPGEPDTAVAVGECLLQSKLSVQLAQRTAQVAEEAGWSIYDPKAKQGWFRHLLVREGKGTGDLVVALVTSPGTTYQVSDWQQSLQSLNAHISGLVWVQEHPDHLEDTILHGNAWLHEQVGEWRFRISLHSFFQTNTEMATKLYQGVVAAAGSGKQIWDLYAGSATIGCAVAPHFTRVLSIESNPSALIDANENVALNHADNLEYRSGSVEQTLTAADITNPPDVVIVDPPRSGLTTTAQQLLQVTRTKKLLYVSCNPQTFVRDALALQTAGYKPISLTGYDLFPHSHHQELLCVLSRTR